MKVLVVGGAGYIGSHMVVVLLEAGHEVVIYDNFSTGYRDAILGGEVVEGDLADPATLDSVLSDGHFDAVMHFASNIEVGESVREPAKYYKNNLINAVNLLDAMRRNGVSAFVFSSSAAVYGEPQYAPLDEVHPRAPVNPYGRTKWMVEQILGDYDSAYGLKAVSLRYFNAAGADPEARIGERHEPESHLIPLVLQAASGRRESIQVFGRDYDTPDGTCIRDYIHVNDLCQAHLAALDRVVGGGESAAYNLGNGNGFSVNEVIETARQVTGREIKVVDSPRRPGDPAVLVADAGLARKELGWEPQRPGLESIIEDAWRWEQKIGRSA